MYILKKRTSLFLHIASVLFGSHFWTVMCENKQKSRALPKFSLLVESTSGGSLYSCLASGQIYVLLFASNFLFPFPKFPSQYVTNFRLYRLRKLFFLPLVNISLSWIIVLFLLLIFCVEMVL